MSKYLESGVLVALCLVAGSAVAQTYGLGRDALPQEIAAWNLDVRPDGTGLPVGSGDVLTGEEIFADRCAACHGDFAEGIDNWPKLAGGKDTLDRKDPVKTVGSYWPYLSTTWDYVNRSMPFGDAQTLTPDEVYATVAYILYSNDLVDDDFVLSNETFLDVELPNADGFIVDDRLTAEFPLWVGEPCMENCKEDAKVTMRAAVLDVTPQEASAAGDEPPVEVAATAETSTKSAPVSIAEIDPALIEAGEKVFRKCKACHQVGEGAKNRTGPVLNGIIDQPAGTVDDFNYSKALVAAAEGGMIWDHETLAAFLTDPKGTIKGTKMSFSGLKSDEDIAAIIAYLSSFQ